MCPDVCVWEPYEGSWSGLGLVFQMSLVSRTAAEHRGKRVILDPRLWREQRSTANTHWLPNRACKSHRGRRVFCPTQHRNTEKVRGSMELRFLWISKGVIIEYSADRIPASSCNQLHCLASPHALLRSSRCQGPGFSSLKEESGASFPLVAQPGLTVHLGRQNSSSCTCTALSVDFPPLICDWRVTIATPARSCHKWRFSVTQKTSYSGMI